MSLVASAWHRKDRMRKFYYTLLKNIDSRLSHFGVKYLIAAKMRIWKDLICTIVCVTVASNSYFWHPINLIQFMQLDHLNLHDIYK